MAAADIRSALTNLLLTDEMLPITEKLITASHEAAIEQKDSERALLAAQLLLHVRKVRARLTKEK